MAGGRRALFDLLTVNEEVKEWLQNGAHPSKRPPGLRQNRIGSLLQELVKKGEVAPEELVRIGGGEVPWYDSKDVGKMTENLLRFAPGWPDCCEAGSLSTQV
jgi:hypothetical protein